MTSISDHYQRMQIVKCELLRNSKDLSIQELFKTREACNARLTRVWKASNVASVAKAEVELELKFPGQENRQGLGFGKYDPNPPPATKRKLVTKKVASFAESDHIIHSLSLKQQSVWHQWAETAEPFDFSWKNVIWGRISPEVLRFVLNSSVNWVRTPDMLKLWGYKSSCFCCLCGAEKCTLHHILSECEFSLKNNRFKWRHDSVLSAIKQALNDHIMALNNRSQPNQISGILFVKAGAKESSSSKRSEPFSLLRNANDWKLLVDLPGENYVFPPEIYCTSDRPDIVIWSPMLKKLILIELTCPAEEGIEAAKVRKQSKYMLLVDRICQSSQWKPTLLTMEVGVRGFVAHSTRSTLLKIGFDIHQSNVLCKQLGRVSASCSYAIFLAANEKAWDESRDLIS